MVRQLSAVSLQLLAGGAMLCAREQFTVYSGQRRRAEHVTRNRYIWKQSTLTDKSGCFGPTGLNDMNGQEQARQNISSSEELRTLKCLS